MKSNRTPNKSKPSSKSSNGRKKELWILVREISEIINQITKLINKLVILRVDVSKFRDYFNQLQSFFVIVSKNINRPITNSQMNVIKAKLENSKQDNIKLLETLRSNLEKSERKNREKLLQKKKKAKRSRTPKGGRAKTKSRPPQSPVSEKKIMKPKKKKQILVNHQGKRLSSSPSSPFLDPEANRNMEGLKERYLRNIEKEEKEIEKLDQEVREIKKQIFEIRTKNTEAIDWHASRAKPIVKAANKKMTMMYLNTRQEVSAQFEEFDEWSKLEHFLKRKIGKFFGFWIWEKFKLISSCG